MANEGQYPKANGDIYYGKDANIAFYGELNSGTMNYGAVTVGTTATVIKAANSSRKTILIRNNGDATIWIGDSGVTISDGKALEPSKSIKLYTQDAIYGIADTSSVDDARYLEVQ